MATTPTLTRTRVRGAILPQPRCSVANHDVPGLPSSRRAASWMDLTTK